MKGERKRKGICDDKGRGREETKYTGKETEGTDMLRHTCDNRTGKGH